MPQHRNHTPKNGYHIYKRAGITTTVAHDRGGQRRFRPDALPSESEPVALAHTQCGRDVRYSDTVNLRGDLSGVKIAECCIHAIGAD
jgi:hypothetical protein